MKISRRGTHRNDGVRSTALDEVRARWNPDKGLVELKAAGVRDFSTYATHNWTIELPAEELVKVFAALVEGCRESPDAIEEQLTPALKSLLKLGAVVSGVSTARARRSG